MFDDLEAQVENKIFNFLAVGETEQLTAVDGNSNVTITFRTTSVTAVLLPGALWLFASGLLLLSKAGLNRKIVAPAEKAHECRIVGVNESYSNKCRYSP